MQSKFDFLAEQFPELAEYGRKAEQALGIDNAICLLNLGEIAETITEILSDRNSIKEKSPDILLKNGVIDEAICLKLKTLTETDCDYSSESSASRLIASALELCEWFMSAYGASRFAFLGDMFPENAPCPPLACLAEYGMEAEANLHKNTRYCLLCLGDIEEAITDMFLESSGVDIPDNLEQHKRINNLLRPLGTANRDKIDVLHDLRQARNDAVHGRYDSEDAAKKLMDEALDLCEWVFMRLVSPGDFVRGRITRITEDEFSVAVGRICGKVSLEDIPPEKIYREGECRVFRVKAKGPEGLSLSLSQAQTDLWANMKRRYGKYEVGQVLSVMLKRISENEGAVVSLGESGEIEARIPKSEFGSFTLPAKSKDAMRPGAKLKARVMEIDPEHYPYMLLSIEDMEREQESLRPDKWERLSENVVNAAMPDKEFVTFCRKASHEQIIAALDGGANPNARSRFGTTPLMEAAHMNEDLGAIRELIGAGANVNARNDKGNTALMFAVMHNVPEAVRLLCENGAEIEPMNNQGRDALSYALTNQRMRNAAGIIQLLSSDEEEASERIAALPPKPNARGMSDRQFVAICKKGKEEAILRAIEGGANVNAKDSHGTTALIYASMYDIPGVVEAMLDRGAKVNAANKKGITPLLIAVMNSRCRNIEILLGRGADAGVSNKKGKTLLEYAKEKLSNKKCEPWLKRIEAVLGLGDSGGEVSGAAGGEVSGAAGGEVSGAAGVEVYGAAGEELAGAAGEELAGVSGDELSGVSGSEQSGASGEELNGVSGDEVSSASSNELPDVSGDEVSSASGNEQSGASGGEMAVASSEELAVASSDELPVASSDELPVASSDELPVASSDELPAASSDELPASSDELPAASSDELPASSDELPASGEELPVASSDELPVASSNELPVASGDELPTAADAQTTLSPEQLEESRRALKLTFQRDILKIARSGSLDDLAQALNSGVSLNVKNKSLATPLMFAAKNNSADVVDLLIKSGAQLNAQDSKGNTPLIYAAAYNTDDIVDTLLDAGADTTLKNLDGYSALDYAKLNYRLIDTNALLRLQQ